MATSLVMRGFTMSARKSPADRIRRGEVVYDDIPICWDGEIRGPALPDNKKWCLQTVAWWQTIRKSAQAMAFQDTDWLHMLDTARLHNKMWSAQQVVVKDDDGNDKAVWMDAKPSELSTLAGEIRRRCENYGFTWADRRKYGIHITSPEQAAQEASQVTRQSAVDYRKKLNGLG